MGINSFTPTSGGFPGQSFIDQVYMTFKVRKWIKSGGPGYYRATSALNKDGYVYFLQSDNTLVQAPINGIANVTLPFTEIRILATQFDMISLYKVSAKGTDSLSLTANYTTITSTGLYNFPNNDVGFCDALLVGGGGAAYHHGGGGGGGGIIEITSIPLTVGGTFAVTVGTYPGVSSNSNGGNTVFQGHIALGGGGAQGDSENGRSGPSGGGATIGSASASRSGGGGGGQVAQLNSDKAQSTWLATLGNSLTVPLLQQAAVDRFTGGSHNGGNSSGNGHLGGGGGGATGSGTNATNGSPGQGGPGLLYNFGDGQRYYSAGGGGSQHSPSNNGPGGGTGWNNSAGHYGMGGDSEHSGGQNGTGGVVIVRTWKV